MKDFGFSTFEKLYESCVVPVLDYGASVWGYKTYTVIDCVQNRAIRYFLGVHRFSANKNIIMCSFKSSGDTQKKEGGPDSCFG